MYFISVTLLLLVLPLAAVVIEMVLFPGASALMWLVGKWFTFFAVGVRLFLGGVRQALQPSFTAEQIFNVKDVAAYPIVREVGFGNLAMGTLGLASLAVAGWIVPAALVGGLYYGLAGLGHALHKVRNAEEQFALVSDVLIFVLLMVFVVAQRV